jgi:hypothetical protein
MARTINTSIVKLRISFNGCLPFKANDHENSSICGDIKDEKIHNGEHVQGQKKI